MGVSAQTTLAHWILSEETDQGDDVVAVCEAAERTCAALGSVLTELVSPVGTQALFSRALYLTRAQFPALAAVRAGGEGGLSLEGLQESLSKTESGEAREAINAIFANLIGLLIAFLGEELTVRLLAGSWPGVASIDDERREA